MKKIGHTELSVDLKNYYLPVKTGEMVISDTTEYDLLISSIIERANRNMSVQHHLSKDQFPAIDFKKNTLIIKQAYGNGCSLECSLEVRKDVQHEQYIVFTSILQKGYCKKLPEGKVFWTIVPRVPDNYSVKFETRVYQDSKQNLLETPEAVVTASDNFLIQQFGDLVFHKWFQRDKIPFNFMKTQNKWVARYQIRPSKLVNAPIQYQTNIRVELDSAFNITNASDLVYSSDTSANEMIDFTTAENIILAKTGSQVEDIIVKGFYYRNHRFQYFFNINRSKLFIDALSGK